MMSETVTFGINKYEWFSRRISDTIIKKIFPNLSLEHYKVIKIHQNIALSSLAVIGKTLTKVEVENLIEECVNRYIFSLASAGDLAGATAAQSVSQPITQAVLKSQHGTGKKQTGNSTSLLSLNRLRVLKNCYKIHLKNEQIPSITKSIYDLYVPQYMANMQEKINGLQSIIDNKESSRYYEIRNFFLNNRIEELKLNCDNEKEIEDLQKSSKSICSFDEANNLLAKIKFDFRLVEKNMVTGDDYLVIGEKLPYNFRVDFELWFINKNNEIIKDHLLLEHEELKIGDLISSSCGKCKYTTITTEEHYDQDENFIYINHHPVQKGSKVFQFAFDPVKIKNSRVDYIKIVEMLFSIPNIMIVIHPLSNFCFDVVQGNNSENIVKETISNIIGKKVKGISGLELINDMKIEAGEMTKFQYYDSELNQTHIFLDQRSLLYFPINEFKKRITPMGNDLELIEECLRPDDLRVFKLVYKGKIRIRPIPYYYYDYCGTIDFNLIKNKLSKFINLNYFISTNHNEMIENFGKISARIAHESFYMDELMMSGNTMNYQNVSLICRHIFGFNLRPITPAGFSRCPGITAVDSLCFQNHQQNLSEELLKNKKYKTDGIINSVFFGKKADLGTNYVKFEINEEQRNIVNLQIAEAKREQKYFAKYKGIRFPNVGDVKPLTNLKFEENFFAN